MRFLGQQIGLDFQVLPFLIQERVQRGLCRMDVHRGALPNFVSRQKDKSDVRDDPEGEDRTKGQPPDLVSNRLVHGYGR